MKNIYEYIGIRTMPNGRANLIYRVNGSIKKFLFDDAKRIKPRFYKNAFNAAVDKCECQGNITIQSLRIYFNEYLENKHVEPDHRRSGFRTYVKPSKYDSPRLSFVISKNDILQLVCRYKKEKIQISTCQKITNEEYNNIFGNPVSEFEKTISDFVTSCYSLSLLTPFDLEIFRERVKKRIDRLPLYL